MGSVLNPLRSMNEITGTEITKKSRPDPLLMRSMKM
jgi:hypothetical protein